jgi:hypothetical protein
MIKVTWNPATTVGIAEYNLESSADGVTYAAVATVTHTIPGPNYDSTLGVFYYDDAAGIGTTWYRVNAEDGSGNVSPWSQPFRATGTPIPTWDTAGNVVNQALVEVGLDNVADPFTDTDSNVKQMCWLLKSLGKKLIHSRMGAPWSYLRREHLFTTVAGQSQYCLPLDYHSMIDQTWWNRTNRLPMGGPVSAQEWQYLKGRLVGIVFNVLFRPMERSLVLYPTGTAAPGGFEIVFEYCSSWWVSTAAAPNTLASDAPTASTDYVWFDPLLLVAGLKLDFLKAKGFDTTSTQQDFNMILEAAKGADAPSPILNATRRWNPIIDPLIGGQSVPVTGFGT